MRGRRTKSAPEPLPVADRKTVAYVRVSSQEQASEGFSLPVQEKRLRAYAASMEWNLAEVIVDAGISAGTLKRPGVQRLLAGLRDRSIGRVLIVKLDRMTRSVRDLGPLLDAFAAADASLVSLGESLDTGSASGRLMVHLLVSVSQWEREAISERTLAISTDKRLERVCYGHVAFGYRRQGDRIVPEPTEQAAIAHMRGMRPKSSFREIVAWLVKHDIRPHRGEWHASSVRHVLNSKIATEAPQAA
jgi:site-specific DNA recombinase